MFGDIERVLEALGRKDVRFLVVGGVAVVLHGHLRTTADLDLVVQLEKENVLHALRALEELGYRPRAPVDAADFADPEIRGVWIREKNLEVFSLWSDKSHFEVDLFVTEPFEFNEVYEQAMVVDLGSTRVRVVPKPVLIAMKRQVGRSRDLDDIESLEALDVE